MMRPQYPSQSNCLKSTNGLTDPPSARRDLNSRPSLRSLSIPSAQEDIPPPFSDSCLRSDPFSQNTNYPDYSSDLNAALTSHLDYNTTTGPDLTPLLTAEGTPLLTAEGTSGLLNVPLPGPNSKPLLDPLTTPLLRQNDPRMLPQNVPHSHHSIPRPLFSTFRSPSELAHQLRPLSCIFKENWAQICETAGATEKRATIRQCLDAKKVSQKKPQEMNSIMASAELSEEDRRWLLDVRRKMMRQRNRQTKLTTRGKSQTEL